MLSEVYWRLGGIAMVRADLNFAEYFKLAYEAYPQNKKKLYMGNVELSALSDTSPGAIERMKEASLKAVPYWEARCGGAGIVYLTHTELDYYTYNLDSAVQNATKAVHAAFKAEHHDVLCMANRQLAYIYFLKGDVDAFYRHTDFVIDYIDSAELDSLSDIREGALAARRLIDRDIDGMTGHMLKNVYKNDDTAPLTSGGNIIVAVRQLLLLGEYQNMLEVLGHALQEYTAQNRTFGIIEVYLLRAIAFFKLDNLAAAADEFTKAYDMVYANNIITPIINKNKPMLELLCALQLTENNYDRNWLKNVMRLTSAHSKHIEKYLSTKAKQIDKSSVVLSRREKEVLQDLAMGLTREEISVTRYISVSTVKTVITNIYNKLGAVNRADAIRIASGKNGSMSSVGV